jgi:hypothetical protein
MKRLGISRCSCWVQSAVASGGVAGVLDLALRRAVFREDDGRQTRHLVGDQRQAAATLVEAALEIGLVGGQRLQQEGALQRHVDDLFSQLFESAQRHVGHGHLLQIRDVLFQVLERLLELQREQAAQPGAVARGGNLRLIEDLDRDRVADVDQRRESR